MLCLMIQTDKGNTLIEIFPNNGGLECNSFYIQLKSHARCSLIAVTSDLHQHDTWSDIIFLSKSMKQME